MLPPTPTHIFISTLTELVNHHRDTRASALARQSKDKTRQFLRHRPYATPTRTAEAPDCVSFFSNTLKGATP